MISPGHTVVCESSSRKELLNGSAFIHKVQKGALRPEEDSLRQILVKLLLFCLANRFLYHQRQSGN